MQQGVSKTCLSVEYRLYVVNENRLENKQNLSIAKEETAQRYEDIVREIEPSLSAKRDKIIKHYKPIP